MVFPSRRGTSPFVWRPDLGSATAWTRASGTPTKPPPRFPIHGKFNHEETRATASRTGLYPGGRYLVVRDLEETERVCEHIRCCGDGEAFRARFGQAASENFDPSRDLEKVGVANQTTMLSSESLEVAERIRLVMAERYGEAALSEHFRSFDTICSATQDRQDAVLKLLKGGG